MRETNIPLKPYHLAQIAALCSRYPMTRKVLIVPSLQTGVNLTVALVRSGQDWLNLDPVTPHALAFEGVETTMGARNLNRLEPDRAFLQMETILRDLISIPEGGYLGGIPLTSGLIRSFYQTIQAMRNAGLAPADLDTSDLEEDKGSLLTDLYARYIHWMKAERLSDEAHIFEIATASLIDAPCLDNTQYAILDETPLSAVAFTFVKGIAGDRLFRIGRDDYGAVSPGDFARMRFPHAPYPDTETVRIGPGGRLLSKGVTPADASSLKVVRVLGAENEVRAVLREALNGGYPLDSIEISYTAENPYLGLVYDAVDRFDIPAGFAAGIPISRTHPGQAILGFYRWISGNMEARELVSLCRSGAITFDRITGENDQIPEPHELAAVLLRERVSRGLGAYENMLVRLERRRRTSPEEDSEDTSERRTIGEETVASMRIILNTLFDLIPSNAMSDMRQVTAASISFIEQFAAVRSDTDIAARDSLRDRLMEIGDGVDIEGPTTRLIQSLSDLLEDHKVGASTARPGHLYVTSLDRAAYASRPHLYVIGMDEGVFPGGAQEDPVLLDNERAGLSGELQLHRLRPRQKVWHLVRALGMAPGIVTLLTNGRHLTDGREVYPSPLFLQIADGLLPGQEEIPPVSSISEPRTALDGTEAMLTARHSSDFGPSMTSRFPWLASGRHASIERKSSRLTRYDGLVRTDGQQFEIADGVSVLSASRLETLSTCPYRYFLRYVLDIVPPQVIEEDASRWLTPLEFGQLLHDLFRDFMVDLHGRNEQPSTTAHGGLMSRLLEETVERYKARIPIFREAAYLADRRRLTTTSEVFLAIESRRTDVTPVGFEVSFGFGEAGDLHEPAPIRLTLSDRVTLLLRGRIDRVDRVPEGYQIWDYKTGSASTFSDQDLLDGGRHLQWALYAYALENMVKGREGSARVNRSGYLFVSDVEQGREIAHMPPTRDEVGRLLEPLMDLVSQGGFIRAINGKPCKFCDYASVCRHDQRIVGKDLPDLTADDRPEILEALTRRLHG